MSAHDWFIPDYKDREAVDHQPSIKTNPTILISNAQPKRLHDLFKNI